MPQIRPNFLRRLGALFYDLCLLAGVVFVSGMPLPLLPTNLAGAAFIKLLTQIYLLGVIFIFFGWFWTHGGQTLGMRAWKLKLVGEDQQEISWRSALRRFCAGILVLVSGGLGYIWMLVDRDGCTWQDRLSHTRFIRIKPIDQAKAEFRGSRHPS